MSENALTSDSLQISYAITLISATREPSRGGSQEGRRSVVFTPIPGHVCSRRGGGVWVAGHSRTFPRVLTMGSSGCSRILMSVWTPKTNRGTNRVLTSPPSVLVYRISPVSTPCAHDRRDGPNSGVSLV